MTIHTVGRPLGFRVCVAVELIYIINITLFLTLQVGKIVAKIINGYWLHKGLLHRYNQSWSIQASFFFLYVCMSVATKLW